MPNCTTYFQQGVKAGLLSGMSSQDMAACNIKRIQKGISAPGLGKPGGGHNCTTYFQQGVKAGLLSGMSSQNMAACNIKRIQKGISAPGLGKPGGRRSTRRGRNNKRSTRRR